ncbi:cytochrome P450 4c3-like isoform X2 [Centruroides sculpturatus]|uniref:cytochrome P450 4c3-like isoform X2 n=1 Tax=Centruroides sculpturatus TaxID=218467 RepID=UPI000C6DA75E|nr:cytochrome P450 4c3-like isoform X2 [Centruroides sculpturatus]
MPPLFWLILFEFRIVFLFSIVLLIIFLWLKNTKYAKNNSQVPLVASLPILKNILSLWRNNLDNDLGVYIIQYLNYMSITHLKEKMFRICWAGHSYVALIHPQVAQEVFKSYNVINKDWTYNIFHPWLETGLLTSSDGKWRNRRKLLTPAFHFRILEDFQDIFYEQSNVLVEKLKETKAGEIIKMSELVTLCTLDIVGDSAMGVKLNAQLSTDNEYVKAVKNVTRSIVQWFSKPWYWFPPLFYVIRRRKEIVIEEIEENQTMDDFQEEREILGIKKRRAFLDLLLYHHLNDGSLTEEDIREEVDTFMFEGHDTTSMGISWTLFLLGLYQDAQEKVFRELNDIFGDDTNRTIKTDDLKEMKYLERVIKESLRLHPSVPFILRRASEELKIGEYTIPRNSSIFVYIYGIHHNPEVYENPEIFDPDRFLPENCENRHPFAYVPFSAGPRNCIGQRFAMNVLKTVCANVLRNFKVRSTQHRDKVVVSGDIILRPKEGIKLFVEKR